MVKPKTLESFRFGFFNKDWKDLFLSFSAADTFIFTHIGQPVTCFTFSMQGEIPLPGDLCSTY